ncbi:prepilin-type N-terminal cleavage/methylation domain-containing protein, partial [Enterobacter hormaechei]
MIKTLNRKKGFSLLEMLLVFGIISALIVGV